MSVLLLSVLIAMAIIVAAFLVFSAVMFYHIRRYSMVGDLSKRAFVIYYSAGITLIVVSLVLIIINHIAS